MSDYDSDQGSDHRGSGSEPEVIVLNSKKLNTFIQYFISFIFRKIQIRDIVNGQ